MGVPSLSKSVGWTRGIVEARAQMFDLQRQLGTGKRAATYGALGSERTLAIAMRSRVSVVESYQSTIESITLRTNVMSQAMERIAEINREMRSDASVPDFLLTDGERTTLQLRAEISLEESLSLLSSEVGGRYLFAGRSVDSDPVVSYDELMNGSGGRAGFKQHLSERRQADLGADGLGRLVIPVPGAADVTVSEDVDGSPFGFKLVALNSGLTGTSTVGPAGAPPAATLSFTATLPEAGETAELTVSLPDGSETRIELTAVAPGEGGAAGTFEIGVDENTTAANFQAALNAAVLLSAQTELQPASGIAASEDFFNIDEANPPQRVDGPPFDTAVALRDGTTADTVFWYTGDAAVGDARSTTTGRVDTSITVSYGARATEEAFRWGIQNLAVLAAETYDLSVDTDKGRYLNMARKGAVNLTYPDNKQTVVSIQAQIVSAEYVAGQANERHIDTVATAEDLVNKIEGADVNEVGIKLLQLQTRLQASYETTSILAQLSLVNYL